MGSLWWEGTQGGGIPGQGDDFPFSQPQPDPLLLPLAKLDLLLRLVVVCGGAPVWQEHSRYRYRVGTCQGRIRAIDNRVLASQGYSPS